MNFQHIIDSVIDEIPVLDSTIDYWLMRANSGEFYTDFNINSYIGIGWNEISLSDIDSVQNNQVQLKRILREKLILESEKEPSEQTYGSTAGQLLRFNNSIKINDLVIVPSERSERFLVGRVINRPFEITDEELSTSQEEEVNYKKSDYKKRIPVNWLGSFNRNQADSALYKMIYTHNTLSTVNDYRSYINRALFPYYIQDNKLYLTYTVTESNDIQGSHLGQFVYQYSQINKILAPENKLDSRINVQSPGVIEFISEYVQAGIYLFILIAIGGITFHGGKLQILGKEFEATGILPRYHKHKQKVQEDELELSRKRLELIEQANELANQLNVPISALGIELPEGLKEKVENNIKAANDEAQKEPNN